MRGHGAEAGSFACRVATAHGEPDENSDEQQGQDRVQEVAGPDVGLRGTGVPAVGVWPVPGTGYGTGGDDDD